MLRNLTKVLRIEAWRKCCASKPDEISCRTEIDESAVHWALTKARRILWQPRTDIFSRNKLGQPPPPLPQITRLRFFANIIGSAEALPILCVRYNRWERERERERERETEVVRRKWRHHYRAKLGDKFALSLAKNSHFSVPRHTSRLSLHWEVTSMKHRKTRSN